MTPIQSVVEFSETNRRGEAKRWSRNLEENIFGVSFFSLSLQFFYLSEVVINMNAVRLALCMWGSKRLHRMTGNISRCLESFHLFFFLLLG